jgi:uncharacterized protein DUF6611
MNEMLDTSRRPARRLPSRLSHWWSRMMDGEYRWGSIDIWPGRHGVHRYRLVVYPPGMTGGERRLLQLRRTWPMWGTVLWLSSAICLAGRPTPLAAIGLATLGSLGIGTIVFVLARRLRSRIRTLGAIVIDGRSDRTSAAAYAELESLVNTLRDTDAKRTEGRLSAVDHEAVCWQVYDCLAPGHAKPVEGQSAN